MQSKTVAFLSRDEALEIHRALLERFGGLAAVRDLGLLESVLYRPRTGYYEDLAGMAAALFESLIMNHPFIDGNKCVAFFATDVFLRLNGYKLKVSAKKAYRFLVGLLEKECCTFDELLPWIREHAVRI
ncbi:MAG: type II toxin-antitoxin system death-on-curing family toxin [Gammaproteobacteria bacterium]|nr:MAG: type II toxin-antitoxin system death-on-curing family toxin [Gammaproteobacteria bacterium]